MIFLLLVIKHCPQSDLSEDFWSIFTSMPDLSELAKKDRKVAVLHRQLDDMERNIEAGQILRDEGNGLSIPMSSFYNVTQNNKKKEKKTRKKKKNQEKKEEKKNQKDENEDEDSVTIEYDQDEENENTKAADYNAALSDLEKRRDVINECVRALCSTAIAEIDRIDSEASTRRRSLREKLIFWDALYLNIYFIRYACHRGISKLINNVIVTKQDYTSQQDDAVYLNNTIAKNEKKTNVEEERNVKEEVWVKGSAMEEYEKWSVRECAQIDVISSMLHNGAWTALRECQGIRHTNSTANSTANSAVNSTTSTTTMDSTVHTATDNNNNNNNGDSSNTPEEDDANDSNGNNVRLGPIDRSVIEKAVLHAAREQFNSAASVFDESLEEASMMLDLVSIGNENNENKKNKKNGGDGSEDGEGDGCSLLLVKEMNLLKAAAIVRDFGCNTILPIELRLSIPKTSL